MPESPHINSDKQLLEAIAAGSESAFNELFRRYWQELYDLAWKSLKDDMEAEDVVHDVLIEIWQRRSILVIDNLPAYLKTAVRNRVINSIKRNRKQAFFEVFEEMARSPYVADNRLLEKDMLELIAVWIEVLPKKRKAVFVRHFYKQLSTREIANELGISQNTVQNQIGTTLDYLRKRFGDLLHLVFLLFFK